MKASPALLAPALIAILVGGCARDDGSFPSLAPRAAEKGGFDEPIAAAPAPVLADPALDARLRDLGAKLDAVRLGFDAGAARADRAAGVAGARTVGSDAWLDAQTALATLDDWRSQASGLATDVETLAGEQAARVGRPYPALESLRTRAAAEADREAAGIARIGGKLPQP